MQDVCHVFGHVFERKRPSEIFFRRPLFEFCLLSDGIGLDFGLRFRFYAGNDTVSAVLLFLPFAVGKDLFDLHVGRSGVDKAEFLGGGFGHIHYAVAVEGAAVVDADDDAFTVGEVGYARIAGDGQRAVGGGEGVHVEAFTTGGFFAVEAGAVP